MNINSKYFTEILKYGNLSEAAKQLGISQPALSGYLKKLESEWGASLLDRTQTPVVLTDTGKLYYEYVKKAEKLEEAFQSELKDLEGNRGGSITIGGAVTSNMCYLAPAINEFRKEYPEINIRIIDGTVPEIMNKAMADELDFFITPAYTAGDAFAHRKLFSEKVLLAVPKDTPEATDGSKTPGATGNGLTAKQTGARANGSKTENGLPICGMLTKSKLKNIKGLDFIFLEEGIEMRKIGDAILSELGLTPKHFVTVSQITTALNLCVNGVGACFVPESVMRCGNFRELPKLYEIKLHTATRDLYLAHKKSHYISKACQRLMELL